MLRLLNKHMVSKRLWEPTDDDIVRRTKRRSSRYAKTVSVIRKKPNKRKLVQDNLSANEVAASKSVEVRPVLRKRRKRNQADVREDSQEHRFESRYKGLENPLNNNRCYFNAVMQCLLYSPLIKQTIESVARSAQTAIVLCEIRNLFTKMTANDAATYVSPSTCFEAVMNTQKCRAAEMSLNCRQEDVHEFLVILLEHLDDELCNIAEVFNIPAIFNIRIHSRTDCQRCLYSSDNDETLWFLTLHFPVGYREGAPDSPLPMLHIDSLIDRFFRVEHLHEHCCAQCGFTGETQKKLDITEAPELLVLHLARFSGGIVKIHTLVEFTTELYTDCIRDGNGQQIMYRLTGMIRHTGYSIAAGHYIAYVLIDGGWYEANDESMELVSWAAVRSLQAYMLFYERQ